MKASYGNPLSNYVQFCAIVSWNQALEYYGYSPQDRPEQAELIAGTALRGFCELVDDVDGEHEILPLHPSWFRVRMTLGVGL